jgi:putative inorganic carbon (hco3(-)) transporter
VSSIHRGGRGPRLGPPGPAPGPRLLIVAVGVLAGGLVASDPLLGVAAVLLLLLGLAVAVRPDLATLAAVAVLYSNAAVVAHRVHGVPKPVSHAVALLLVIALAHHLGLRRAPVRLPAALPWVGLFLVVQVASAVGSDAPGAALGNVTDFVSSGLLLFVAFSNAIRTEQVLRQTIWVILVVGALLGSLSLHQASTHRYHDDYLGFAQVAEDAVERHVESLDDEEFAQPRLAGPIGEKNFYAQFMFVLVPVGLLLFAAHPQRSRRFLALGFTGVIAAGGAMTASRGGAIGLALALLVLAAIRFLPLRHLLVAVIGIGVVFSTSPRYVDRLTSIGSVTGVVSEESYPGEVDGATLGRLGANVAALRVFAENPVIGVGPGRFNSYYRDQAIEAGLRVHEGDRAAHNLYLQVAAETGLLGAVALFGAIAVTLRDLARERRRWLHQRPDFAAILGGMCGAIVTYLTTGLFLSRSYERYFWFLLAVGAAGSAISRELAQQRGAADLTPRSSLASRTGLGQVRR